MQSLKRESWVSCRVLSVLTEIFFMGSQKPVFTKTVQNEGK